MKQLPITEAHTYNLSTAENELGVVIAHSDADVSMVPINWSEMQCPKTLVKVGRKVAKVLPENDHDIERFLGVGDITLLDKPETTNISE